MNNLKIRAFDYSDAIWASIFSSDFSKFESVDLLNSIFKKNEYRRVSSSFNTGTISLATSYCLLNFLKLISPFHVAEIGTFIGNSASVISYCQSLQKDNFVFETCDLSNDIDIDIFGNGTLIQHKLKSSFDMLNDIYIRNSNTKPDVYFIDGRLSKDDLKMMFKIGLNDSVIILDDFEGIEKGTFNSILLQSAGILKSHFLVLPPSNSLLDKSCLINYLGLSPSTLAFFIPINKLSLVTQ